MSIYLHLVFGNRSTDDVYASFLSLDSSGFAGQEGQFDVAVVPSSKCQCLSIAQYMLTRTPSYSASTPRHAIATCFLDPHVGRLVIQVFSLLLRRRNISCSYHPLTSPARPTRKYAYPHHTFTMIPTYFHLNSLLEPYTDLNIKSAGDWLVCWYSPNAGRSAG